MIHLVLQIWKPIVVIVGLALIIGFAVSWIISIIGIFYGIPFLDYLQPDSRMLSILAGINVLFLVGIPIISISTIIARLLLGTRTSKAWNIGLSVLWGINIICLVSIGTNLGKQFSAGSEITKSIDLGAIESDTIKLSLAPNPYEHVIYYVGDHLQLTDRTLVSYNIHLDIEKAAEGVEEFELVQENYSRGYSLAEANQLAEQISTPIVVDETGVTLPQNFQVEQGGKWRAQKVHLTLKIPEGKSIELEDMGLDLLLGHININDPNDFSIWNNISETWTMGSEGLACSSCLPQEEEEGMSYKDFSKLKIDGKMKVYVEKGDQYKVHINGKKQHTEKVNVLQMDETLLVSTELERTSSPIRVFITMPNLHSLETQDTDDIQIKGFKEPSMSLSSNGRYEVKAFIDVDSLMLTQVGRNEVDIRGNCNYLQANLRDRSRLDAEKVAIREVDISAQNRCSAKLAVIDKIRQQSDQESKISVEGNPSVVIQQ